MAKQDQILVVIFRFRMKFIRNYKNNLFNFKIEIFYLKIIIHQILNKKMIFRNKLIIKFLKISSLVDFNFVSILFLKFKISFLKIQKTNIFFII